MNIKSDKARVTAGPYRRPALTWIDFLVIAAIALTFAAIVSTTLAQAKAATATAFDPPTYSNEVGEAHDDVGLIKARVRLANGGPWG
ncbi:MAG: hypothetical protein ACOY4R_25655 [Pseudomonadota bacterium]